jgi:hypothetical protein
MALSIPAQSVEEWLAGVPAQSPYKRVPYRRHKDHIPELEPIFRAIQNPVPTGGLAALAKRDDIPGSTLRTWKARLEEDRDWRPSHEAYSYAQKVFTIGEELRLVTYIQEHYLSKGLYYSDEDFRIDALAFVQNLLSEYEMRIAQGETIECSDTKRLTTFKCSRKFIKAFRLRHRFSLRRPNLKRRPTVNPQQAADFIAKVKWLKESGKYPRDRIINIDETNWRTVASGFLTWGLKGAESVQCNIDNDDKEGVTVIAAINAEGQKLPLTVIGKGKTPKCLAGYQLDAQVWSTYSDSGWTTSDVMCRYFAFLRRRLFPDGPVLLILDTYAAHRAEIVREIARLWGIDLVFIPPGCTDSLQPLDRRVFGALKGYARQQWRMRYHRTHGAKVKRPEIARGLQEAWERITPQTIMSAWSIYETGWGDDEESDEANPMTDGEYQQLISVQDALDL